MWLSPPHCTYMAPSYPLMATSSGFSFYSTDQMCLNTTQGTRGSSHTWLRIRGSYIREAWPEMTTFITKRLRISGSFICAVWLETTTFTTKRDGRIPGLQGGLFTCTVVGQSKSTCHTSCTSMIEGLRFLGKELGVLGMEFWVLGKEFRASGIGF